jgi:hypothetical protein
MLDLNQAAPPRGAMCTVLSRSLFIVLHLGRLNECPTCAAWLVESTMSVNMTVAKVLCSARHGFRGSLQTFGLPVGIVWNGATSPVPCPGSRSILDW